LPQGTRRKCPDAESGHFFCPMIDGSLLKKYQYQERKNEVKSAMKLALVFLLFALVLNGAGCSQLSGPSDEEILKAIDDSGILKVGGFTVVEPIVILEKGRWGTEGTWPVTVKLTMAMVKGDGQTSKIVTTPKFRIHKSKDSTGKTVWTAKLGA
jgi:hypothetical protein